MITEQYTTNKSIETIQNIILENRGKLKITGVKDVFSFDDLMVILDTELGMLTIKGENLRINKLSLDTTEVAIDGTINSLNYSEKTTKKTSGSVWGKLFK